MNERKINHRVANSMLGALVVFIGIAFISRASADEIVHTFKNPSFSGIGQ